MANNYNKVNCNYMWLIVARSTVSYRSRAFQSREYHSNEKRPLLNRARKRRKLPPTIVRYDNSKSNKITRSPGGGILSWYRANAKINCCFSALVQVIKKSGKEGLCLPVALVEPSLGHSADTSG